MDFTSPTLLEWIPFALLAGSVGVILCLCSRKRPTAPLLPRYTTHNGSHFTAHTEPVSMIETCVQGGTESETPLFVVAELPKLSFRHV